MVYFPLMLGVKKDTIFGAVRKFFGPSHFMTPLVEYKCKKVE